VHIVGDGPKKFLLSQSVSEFSHRLGPQQKSRPKETANQSGHLLRWNCPTYGETPSTPKMRCVGYLLPTAIACLKAAESNIACILSRLSN
jgi:hypothetical protein